MICNQAGRVRKATKHNAIASAMIETSFPRRVIGIRRGSRRSQEHLRLRNVSIPSELQQTSTTTLQPQCQLQAGARLPPTKTKTKTPKRKRPTKTKTLNENGERPTITRTRNENENRPGSRSRWSLSQVVLGSTLRRAAASPRLPPQSPAPLRPPPPRRPASPPRCRGACTR